MGHNAALRQTEKARVHALQLSRLVAFVGGKSAPVHWELVMAAMEGKVKGDCPVATWLGVKYIPASDNVTGSSLSSALHTSCACHAHSIIS